MLRSYVCLGLSRRIRHELEVDYGRNTNGVFYMESLLYSPYVAVRRTEHRSCRIACPSTALNRNHCTVPISSHIS